MYLKLLLKITVAIFIISKLKIRCELQKQEGDSGSEVESVESFDGVFQPRQYTYNDAIRKFLRIKPVSNENYLNQNAIEEDDSQKNAQLNDDYNDELSSIYDRHRLNELILQALIADQNKGWKMDNKRSFSSYAGSSENYDRVHKGKRVNKNMFSSGLQGVWGIPGRR